MKKNLNQKVINLIEYSSLINTNLLLSDKPLKRNPEKTITTFSGTKLQKLNKLRNNIQLIKNCLLKKNATNLVFADGNLKKYMIECPLHGWVYDIRDGKCLSLGDRFTISYKLRIQDNILEINIKR